MCRAPLQIKEFNYSSLPIEPISLDMFILRDQEIVITSNWVIDQTITMGFPGRIEAINQRFSQVLVLVKQPFNQALVLIDQEFQFVNMNHSLKFMAIQLKTYNVCLRHLVKLSTRSRHFCGNCPYSTIC